MIKVKVNRKTRQVLFDGEGRRFIENGVRKAFSEIGKFVSKEVSNGIKRPPKTGRYYRYKGRRYRASAPGEYPANRSGTLRRSVGFKVNSKRKMTVFAKAPYAEFLEEGTKIMAPRKLLGHTIEKNTNKIRDIFIKNVNSELKG